MTPATMSAEELSRLNLPDKRTELVRGRLVVREPAGFRHGSIAAALATEIAVYVRQTHAGLVLAAETGFRLATNPDTVRAPDVAFVRADRLPASLPIGYAEFPPDIAIEVLSPDDRPPDVRSKVADWLTAGTRLVWVVDPSRREARVSRADGTETLVPEHGALDAEDVLPGFRCPLGSVL